MSLFTTNQLEILKLAPCGENPDLPKWLQRMWDEGPGPDGWGRVDEITDQDGVGAPLDGLVWYEMSHQGDIYAPAAIIVPFYCKLIDKYPSFCHKELLSQICHAEFSRQQHWWPENQEHFTPEVKDDYQNSLRVLRKHLIGQLEMVDDNTKDGYQYAESILTLIALSAKKKWLSALARMGKPLVDHKGVLAHEVVEASYQLSLEDLPTSLLREHENWDKRLKANSQNLIPPKSWPSDTADKSSLRIERLWGTPEIEQQLSDLLIATVAAGGSVGFMHPVAPAEAKAFWTQVLQDAANGQRVIFGAWEADQLLGTVTLIVGLPPNQPHRAEIAKMMTHPQARGRGIASRLMQAAEAEAVARGKKLLVLDTASDEGAGPFYQKLGFTLTGEIPDFALKPYGGLTGTLFYWKKI